LSKLDQNHPFVAWLKSRNMALRDASLAVGRSQACVGRWIKGIREPGPIDLEKIAALTEGEVAPAVWHEQALSRALDKAA
jgi:hypothetical protein